MGKIPKKKSKLKSKLKKNDFELKISNNNKTKKNMIHIIYLIHK